MNLPQNLCSMRDLIEQMVLLWSGSGNEGVETAYI
ncbi:MAG: hypothetical protein ACI95C_001998, partial [Pseudohongiellaceae bacterium]